MVGTQQSIIKAPSKDSSPPPAPQGGGGPFTVTKPIILLHSPSSRLLDSLGARFVVRNFPRVMFGIGIILDLSNT